MGERSPLERTALTYAAPRGIPLSVFLGRVVYPGDPQWLDDDLLAALEWQTEQAGRCKDCGQDLDASTARDNHDEYEAEGVSCHGCRAIDRAAHKLAGNETPNPLAGVRWKFTHIPEEAG